MRTAVGTVVYQQSQTYIDEFVQSLNCCVGDFDLVLQNDNLSSSALDSIAKQAKMKSWFFQSAESLTPQHLRLEMIKNALKSDFNLLILLDFDDLMEHNRVASHLEQWDSDYAFFYNELLILDANVPFLMDLPHEIRTTDLVVESNFLGFSNTGLNLKKIDLDFLDRMRKSSPKAFDWYFWGNFIKSGATGKLLKNCSSFYRIHENNTAGICSLTKKNMEREVQIKKEIYDDFYRSHILPAAFFKTFNQLTDNPDLLFEHLLQKKSQNYNRWWQLIQVEESKYDH